MRPMIQQRLDPGCTLEIAQRRGCPGGYSCSTVEDREGTAQHLILVIRQELGARANTSGDCVSAGLACTADASIEPTTCTRRCATRSYGIPLC